MSSFIGGVNEMLQFSVVFAFSLIYLLVQVYPKLLPDYTFHISHTVAVGLLYQNH